MISIKRVIVALVWLVMLGMPIYVVLNELPPGFWGLADANVIRAVFMRLIGLALFTLITQQILMQEFRPFFSKIMGPYFTKRYHIIVGTFTLLFALLHPILYYVSALAQGSRFLDVASGQGYPWPTRYFYLLGPFSLLILICTALSGLLRRAKWLQKYWYLIHKLNYLLFITAFVHSWNVGSDVQTNQIIRTLWLVYLTVIVLGFINKFVLTKYRARFNQTTASESSNGEPVKPLTAES